MGTIIENIQEGTRIADLPISEISEKIITALNAYKFMGYDYEFFKKEILENISYYLKNTYKELRDKELTFLLSAGLSGEYGKNPREIKGYNINSWAKEYMKKRDEAIIHSKQDRAYEKPITEAISKHPMGLAILYKMDYLATKDWKKIDTKELAKLISQEDGKTKAMKYCENLGIQITIRNNF